MSRRRYKKYDLYTFRGWLEWGLPATVLIPLVGPVYWLTEWVAPKPSEIALLFLCEILFLSWTYLWKLWPWVRLDDKPRRAKDTSQHPDAAEKS